MKYTLFARLFALLLIVIATTTVSAQSETETVADYTVEALYIPMPDGIQIAVDVLLPAERAENETLPTVIRSTRYVRALDRQPPGEEDLAFVRSGYAVVLVDARGSGASSGQRTGELAPQEVADLGEIVEWIVAQSWSNGRVGAYGVSYDGDTAEMNVVPNHPAVRVVAPLYNDFDVPALFSPGGVINDWFATNWGGIIAMLDANDICGLAGVEGLACTGLRLSYSTGIKPVDSDANGEQLAAILAERDNVDIAALVAAAEFADDITSGPNAQYAGPYLYEAEIEQSGVPMLVWAGWLDASTADGSIARYLTFDTPQVVVIGPFSHSGSFDIDPFNTPDQAVEPTQAEQFTERLAYFDALLKEDGEVPESSITYYTLNAGTWNTTTVWPPQGFETQTRWFFVEGNGLSTDAPTSADGEDSYAVDFSTTTGETTRWHTQLGGEDVIYPDRAEADANLLTYTSEPLATDVEITGAPVVTLQLASTHEDGALHVYLEDVAPDGRVTYITEGILRLPFYPLQDPADSPYVSTWPQHDISEAAYTPLVPGELTEVTLHLYNTSVLIEAGHSIRIAIAGADAGLFRRYPAEGTPTLTVSRSGAALSYVDLPMMER